MASSRAPREIIGIRQRYRASSARILRATFSPCNWRALTISSPDLRTRCPLKGGYGAAQRDAGRVGRGIWRAATWHLGFIAPASGRAGRRSSVQTTRTRIGRRQHRGARVSRRFTQTGANCPLSVTSQNAPEHRVRICHVRFRGWNSSSTDCFGSLI
jgi:hypothetical protein